MNQKPMIIPVRINPETGQPEMAQPIESPVVAPIRAEGDGHWASLSKNKPGGDDGEPFSHGVNYSLNDIVVQLERLGYKVGSTNAIPNRMGWNFFSNCLSAKLTITGAIQNVAINHPEPSALLIFTRKLEKQVMIAENVEGTIQFRNHNQGILKVCEIEPRLEGLGKTINAMIAKMKDDI